MVGCLQYEGDILGVDDKGRERQTDAVVASTVWGVPLHAVSAEVSDVRTAPRLI